MKQSLDTAQLFQKVLDETPQEIKQQVEWSYGIADKIDDRLRHLGWSRKEFAKRAGISEATASKWIGGGHNFTLSTLTRISSVLGIPVISLAR